MGESGALIQYTFNYTDFQRYIESQSFQHCGSWFAGTTDILKLLISMISIFNKTMSTRCQTS